MERGGGELGICARIAVILQLPNTVIAVMAGLVPAIHAAKLTRLLRKRRRMRGLPC